MSVELTAIANVLIVRQPTHGDDRGFFRQTYILDELEQALGRPVRFAQSNHVRSQPGVLRGFHAEPWDKLVYVSSGTVLAVIADIRPDSPTFGEHVSVLLGDGAGERVRLFVGEGLGNAYCVLGDRPADYLYDVTAVWTPGVDKQAVRWDDPTLDVAWPVDEPTLSGDDRDAPTLAERFPHHPRFAGDRNDA